MGTNAVSAVNGYPSDGYPSNGYPSNGYPSNGYPGDGYSGNGYSALTGRLPQILSVSPRIAYPGDIITITLTNTVGFSKISFQGNDLGSTASPNSVNGTVITNSLTNSSVQFLAGSRTGIGALRVFFGGSFAITNADQSLTVNDFVTSVLTGTLVFPGQSATLTGLRLDDVISIETTDLNPLAATLPVMLSGATLLFPGQTAVIQGSSLLNITLVESV